MSISTIATKDSYAGNNSNSTPYPITFKYFDSDHVTVYADGVEISSGGLDYCTFAGDGATGTGEFTTSAIYAPTVTITVVLDVPFDQPVVLQETGSLPAKTIEVEGFDRLNMQIRRVWRKLGDVLTFNTDEANGSTGTADNLIGFDGSGDIAEIPNTTFLQQDNNLSELANAPDQAAAQTNLNVDPAGTDNSTDVTKTGAGTYVSLAGQVLTVDEITEGDLNASINASLDKADTSVQVANNLSDVTAATARTNLGVDAAGTDNSTDVTKVGTGTYVSLDTGTQVLTVDEITEGDLNASINASLDLADTSIQSLASIEGNSLLSTSEGVGKVLQADGDNTCSWVTLGGGGDALVANPLSQFAPTTSLQLKNTITDETGTGSLVFATSPALVTPDLGTPSALNLANATGTPTSINLTNATNTPLPAAGTVTEAMLNTSTNLSLDKADGSLQVTNNLSEVTATTARTNLGLGTLATQSGTFSGTSSGTNTGDELTATVTTEGVVELATQAEVDAGTDTSRVVTPETLANYSGLAETPPSVTGTASFTLLTNNIALTGVGLITGLAVGDVVEVSGSTSNDGFYTVDVITDDDNIIVNQAHANGTAGAGKTLTGETSTPSVTVTLDVKANHAPAGHGQAWIDVLSVRLNASTSYQNTTGRSIQIGHLGQDSDHLEISNDNVNWVQVMVSGGGGGNWRSGWAIIPNNHYYRVLSAGTSTVWCELR